MNNAFGLEGGCAALEAARPQSLPPEEWSRSRLAAAVCQTYTVAEQLDDYALACSAGPQCEASRLSGGEVVGAAIRRPLTTGGILCTLCIVRQVQYMADQSEPPRVLPFGVAVGNGPDEVHPRDCHPAARDGEICVLGNMITLPALGMRWDGARLHADGLGARDRPANGGLCLYLYGDHSGTWVHLPVARSGQRLVSPLVWQAPGGKWVLRSVSREAGLPHFDGSAEWEARVADCWIAHPERRLWLGALCDTAVVCGAGCGDTAGPWPGDLPDILTALGEMSRMAVFNSDFSAPADMHGIVTFAIKTQPWPAYRRECASILAKLVHTTLDTWPLLMHSLMHVLLGTWPVPAEPPSLVRKSVLLEFVPRLRDPLQQAKWIHGHAPITMVAMFYLRYVADRSRGAAWAQQPVQNRRFWAGFEQMLVLARSTVLLLREHGGTLSDAADNSRRAFVSALDAGAVVAWAGFGGPVVDIALRRIAEGKKDAVEHAWALLTPKRRAKTADDSIACFGIAVRSWISHGRKTVNTPARATWAGFVPGGPPAPGLTAEYCVMCTRIVHREMGTRGPCKFVKKQMRKRKSCCCKARAGCSQRRERGCCCATKSLAVYDVDTDELRCRLKRNGRECNHAVVSVPMDGKILLLPAHGRAAYVACVDCERICLYRRSHHYSSGYHCGCAAVADTDPCFLCDTGEPGGIWTLHRDGVPFRLCAQCAYWSHVVQQLRPLVAPDKLRDLFFAHRWLGFARRMRLRGAAQ